jgi:hypothetical protein
MPWQISSDATWKFGALVIRALQSRSLRWPRSSAWKNRCRPPCRRAYVAPYDSWANRISTVALRAGHSAAARAMRVVLLVERGARCRNIRDRPAFIGWGLSDFVFDRHFLEGFRAALPQAEVHAFAGRQPLRARRQGRSAGAGDPPVFGQTLSTRSSRSAPASPPVSAGSPCARRALSHCALASPDSHDAATSRHACGRSEWIVQALRTPMSASSASQRGCLVQQVPRIATWWPSMRSVISGGTRPPSDGSASDQCRLTR